MKVIYLISYDDYYMYYTDLYDKNLKIEKERREDVINKISNLEYRNVNKVSSLIRNKFKVLFVLLKNRYNQYLVLRTVSKEHVYLEVLTMKEIREFVDLGYRVGGILSSVVSGNKLVIRENKEILVSPYFPEYLIDKIAIKNQNRHSRGNRVVGYIEKVVYFKGSYTHISHNNICRKIYDSRIHKIYFGMSLYEDIYDFASDIVVEEVNLIKENILIIQYDVKDNIFIGISSGRIDLLDISIEEVILNRDRYRCKVRFDEESETFVIQSLCDVVQINRKLSLKLLDMYKNNINAENRSKILGIKVPIENFNGELIVRNNIKDYLKDKDGILELPDKITTITKNSFIELQGLKNTGIKRIIPSENLIDIEDGAFEYIEGSFYLVAKSRHTRELVCNYFYNNINLTTKFIDKTIYSTVKINHNIKLYLQYIKSNNIKLSNLILFDYCRDLDEMYAIFLNMIKIKISKSKTGTININIFNVYDFDKRYTLNIKEIYRKDLIKDIILKHKDELERFNLYNKEVLKKISSELNGFLTNVF